MLTCVMVIIVLSNIELSNLLYGLNIREQYRMLKELVSEEQISMEQFHSYANVFPTTTRYRDYGY